ncbi:hypothetical protein Emin_1465 [Elusimicrobium minutum Pei191]|uniref:Uncharacterized protein n=1 Tax=Elusimicrobium minutum (strain Pei191) TaxID=445932 RepID=B2KER7_ELUMP|nr:DUF4105 domain-containing protein [Elusimicrobium minutum]ACC99013.1 hypothetical protein Emin_1465 [Elusimicrobium minutum Pei191]
MRKVTLSLKLILPLSFFFISIISHAQLKDAEYFKQSAAEKQLHKNSYWSILMHYNRGKSDIVSPSFFVSKNGMQDPQQELNAFIEALFLPHPDKQSVECRFPLRTMWIKEQLGITEDLLPSQNCYEFQNFIDFTKPQSVSIFYISQSLATTEDLFGQMGIKINKHSVGEVEQDSLSFSAQMTKKYNPFTVLLGAFSGFSGNYVITPFSETAKKYVSDQNRNIWEYSLDFTPEQIKKIIMHMWELKDAEIRYSFFALNGAPAIESALRVAVPDLNTKAVLRKTPLDLTQSISEAGIIEKTTLYPAEGEEYSKIKSSLDKQGKADLERLEKQAAVTPEDLECFDPKQKPFILSALQINNDMKLRGKQISAREHEQKLECLDFNDYGFEKRYLPPRQISPVKAHPLTRTDAAFGYNSYRESTFTKLRINPLSHEIIDSNIGFAENISLSFLSLESRYYFEQEDVDLSLTLYSLSALPRINIKPAKMSFSSSLSLSTDKNNHALHRYKGLIFNNSIGVTYGMSKFLDIALLVKMDAEANNSPKGYYVGTGGIVQMIISYTDNTKTLIYFNYDYGTSGHPSRTHYINATQGVYINENMSFLANYQYHFSDYSHIWDAGIAVYF